MLKNENKKTGKTKVKKIFSHKRKGLEASIPTQQEQQIEKSTTIKKFISLKTLS